MNKVIKNCLVTRSDALVLKEYCVDASSDLYKIYKSFNVSVNLQATSVYAMYAGVVSMLCKNSNNTHDVIMLLNSNQAIKYGDLKEVHVKVNQFVDVSTYLGEANKYVKIEYMSTFVKSPYLFRVGDIVMYKDDPMKILDPSSNEIRNESQQYSESGLQGFVDKYDGGYQSSFQFMLSNNRGDD